MTLEVSASQKTGSAFAAELEEAGGKHDDMPASFQGMTPEETRQLEKRLVRKIDVRLMPAVIIMYLLNYIDRNNIASARLGGLEDDLNLKGNQYQTCECLESCFFSLHIC